MTEWVSRASSPEVWDQGVRVYKPIEARDENLPISKRTRAAGDYSGPVMIRGRWYRVQQVFDIHRRFRPSSVCGTQARPESTMLRSAGVGRYRSSVATLRRRALQKPYPLADRISRSPHPSRNYETWFRIFPTNLHEPRRPDSGDCNQQSTTCYASRASSLQVALRRCCLHPSPASPTSAIMRPSRRPSIQPCAET